MNLIEEIKKIAVTITPEDEFEKLIKSNKKLKIKIGADPSRPDLHLGHSVIFRTLKKFQDLGHEIIFVIGDFTAMIGDPSGKNITRPVLTHEQTTQNAETYLKQVTKILDKTKIKIKYNSEWLNKMDFKDIIGLAGKYTLARIMERDDFKNRFANNFPIGIHELLYPLLQGYDSVVLENDIEVGGTDQTFNLIVGRELQKSYEKNNLQCVVTFPLLIGLDGVEKMSKSLKNDIGLDEEPFLMYEKCMKIPDKILEDYFALTTDIKKEIYQKAMEDPFEAHFLYADYIVSFYHNKDIAKSAKAKYNDIRKNVLPNDLEVFFARDNMNIVDLLYETKLAKSKSEARRLIEGKGVKVNNTVVLNIDQKVSLCDGIVLSKGKKFIKILKNTQI